MTQLIKGKIQEEKYDLRNALSCYTEGIEVKCKDARLNFVLYFDKSKVLKLLGEFR